MFRRFAGILTEGANGLFIQHPSVLTALLEVAWQSRIHELNQPLGSPSQRSRLPSLPDEWLNKLIELIDIARPDMVSWEHLIYAYMIENTRIYEIFQRILHEFLYGEKFGVPTAAAQHWLRNTEEMFYRNPPSFSITTITSNIRTDSRAIRRNAYWRLFGMDLNHGTENGEPYPYTKADAYNNEFVTVFEEFLRESWVAIANIKNTSGTNPTDKGKIKNIVENIYNMLISRRSNGNISREEFVAISTMSWFHLTVSFDSPIILALRAEAASPEQRLFKIALRVGLPAHGLSKSLFDIADPLSRILILIESGELNSLPVDPDPPFAPNVQEDLNTIITHWSIITGRDMKARKVAST
jgi:hypothetical protein